MRFVVRTLALGFSFPACLSVTTLLNADVVSRQGQNAYEPCKDQLSEYEVGNKQLASIADIGDSMKQQLLILVEWAKYIPAFSELTLDDQVKSFRPVTQSSSGRQSPAF